MLPSWLWVKERGRLVYLYFNNKERPRSGKLDTLAYHLESPHDIFNTIRLFGMFEHLRKIPAKDKNILRFGEVSNAWRSKITGYFSKARRTSEPADRRYILGGRVSQAPKLSENSPNKEIVCGQNFSFRQVYIFTFYATSGWRNLPLSE